MVAPGLCIESMDRRRFLKLLPAIGPISLGSVNLLPFLERNADPVEPLLRGYPGKAVVIIELKGGNDGLNTFIPINQYDAYRALRPSIGLSDKGLTPLIRLDDTLPGSRQLSLHPSLVGLKKMYDRGWMAVLQGVGNDISSQLNNKFDLGLTFTGTALQKAPVPGKIEYPFCLQIGDPNTPLGQHGESAHMHVLKSLGWNDQGIQGLLGGSIPIRLPDVAHLDQIEWISEMDRRFPTYADQIMKAYNVGSNAKGSEFPDTRLSGQLKAVSRLINGGCKTPIYMCQLGGFDTHLAQAEAGNPSEGIHSALLRTLSEAVLAFMDDLQKMQLADRVLLCTYSEFGRSYQENSVSGTEHGTLAPMMLFGTQVTPGVLGVHPDITNPGLSAYKATYRQVMDAVLAQWLGMESRELVLAAQQV